MSSPVAINRPASPTESSSDVSSSVSSNASTLSRSSARTLVYTRDELLALATSPLSHAPLPPAVAAFPMILRKIRRGVLEAYQALEYARSSSGHAPEPAPTPTPEPAPEPKPAHVIVRSPKANAGHLPQSSPLARARESNLPAKLQPPMLKVDAYVPPARRVEQEQRVRPGRDARSSRTWRRPAPARSQTQSRW